MSAAKIVYKILIGVFICLPIVVLALVFTPIAIAWQHSVGIAEDVNDWISDQMDK